MDHILKRNPPAETGLGGAEVVDCAVVEGGYGSGERPITDASAPVRMSSPVRGSGVTGGDSGSAASFQS